MIVSARTGRILAFGVVLALALGSDALLQRGLTESEDDAIRSGHPDTPDAGALAARADIARGMRRIMMYGLINDGYGVSKRLRRLGYEALFGGCVVGGPGYAFWTGYNREMALAAKTESDRSTLRNLYLL